MFTLFRVMSGAQSDGESEALDSALDRSEVNQKLLVLNVLKSSCELPCHSLPGRSVSVLFHVLIARRFKKIFAEYSRFGIWDTFALF